MKCWVCSREARGYGHSDGRFKAGDPRRYVLDWVFCSRHCQDVFHRMVSQWEQALRYGEEFPMPDFTAIERTAMRTCLKPFGAVAEAVGFDMPLGSYSEQQALQVIEAIVSAWTQAMAAHHEQTLTPPVRGLDTPVRDPLRDPLRPARSASVHTTVAPTMLQTTGSGFEDMDDDIPF